MPTPLSPDSGADRRNSFIALISLAAVLLGFAVLAAWLAHEDAHTATADAVPPAPTFVNDAGLVTLTAVGFADTRGRDARQVAAALEADARRQLVEKTAALFMVGELLDLRYALVADGLLANSATYLGAVEPAGTPYPAGGDLHALTLRGTVDAHAVRTALRQLGRNHDLRLLRHGDEDVPPAIERVRLRMLALPTGIDTLLLREFSGLRNTLAIAMTRPGSSAYYELDLIAGNDGDPVALIVRTLLMPLHEKAGVSCLGVSNRAGNEVTLAWNASCHSAEVLARLETQAPAGLIVAPTERKAAFGL